MEVACLAVGRLKAGPETELCARYLDRARKSGKYLGFRGFGILEIAESRAARPLVRIADDRTLLMPDRRGNNRVDSLRNIVRDPRVALMFLIPGHGNALRINGRATDAAVARTTFVSGGPDGLGSVILGLADRRLSLGRLVWPHQLARVLLAEQLYRAMTILSGHPYHRA